MRSSRFCIVTCIFYRLIHACVRPYHLDNWTYGTKLPTKMWTHTTRAVHTVWTPPQCIFWFLSSQFQTHWRNKEKENAWEQRLLLYADGHMISNTLRDLSQRQMSCLPQKLFTISIDYSGENGHGITMSYSNEKDHCSSLEYGFARTFHAFGYFSTI